MLFLSIFTYEPEKRNEIIGKRIDGLVTPEGAKLHGQWSQVSGGRTFTLFEVDDAVTAFKWCYSWSDLGKFEVIPVVATDDLMKAMAALK